MGKIRVLVADDHAIMRDGIRALVDLHDDIEIVEEASNGKEAVEKAIESAPDVIVMDIAMPDLDGLEASRRIIKKNSKIKVLILTQHDNKEYIISAIKAGVSGFVPKRALGDDLISAIRAISRNDSFLYPSAASTIIEDYRKETKEELYDQLTARERELIKLIADGFTNREIADRLFLTVKTVTGHRTKIMRKLDLHSHTELVKFAIRKGLTIVDT